MLEQEQIQTANDKIPDMFFDAMNDLKAEKEGKMEDGLPESKEEMPENKSDNKKESKGISEGSPDKSEKEEDFKSKYEKAEDLSQKNMKYARSVNQKLKETLKVIDELVENTVLDEETAGKIYGVLKADGLSLPEESFASKAQSENDHPFDKHKQRLDPELFQTYQDVSEDAEAFKKLKAFDQYLMEAEESELKDLDKELSEIKSPMALLKKILSVGNGFLEEGLGDFYKHGGFRKYLSAQKEENDKLHKELDKVKRKLSQYESNESSGNFWLSSDSDGSKGDAKPKETGDMWKDMKAEEELEKRRARR